MRTRYSLAQTVVLLTVFCSILAWNEKPELKIFPEVSTLRGPTSRPISISCRALGDDRAFSQMAWRDNKGNTIPEGLNWRHLIDVRQLSSHYLQLMFMSPQVAHNGEYVCSALYTGTNWNSTDIDRNSTGIDGNSTGIDGNSTILEASINVDFYITPKVKKFENITATEGGVALLVCSVHGDPAPNVTIRKIFGRNFTRNQDIRTQVLPSYVGFTTTVSLRITGVKRADDGLYNCSAKSGEYYVDEIGRLEVEFAPNVSATPQHQKTTLLGSTANVTCIAEANPNATITWKFKNETIHPEDERYIIRNQFEAYQHRTISKLLIRLNGTDKNHYDVLGIYTCIARNMLGESSIDISIEHAVVPGQIAQILFDKATPTSIIFIFLGPSNNGGMPVTSYVVNYTANGTHYSSTEWPKGSIYILTNLKPGTLYTFKVAAKNAVGTGEWSTVSYVMPTVNVTEPPERNVTDPHTLITKDVDISDYPDRFEIKWKALDDNGHTRRYFVITYFNDGRIMVQHSNRNGTMQHVRTTDGRLDLGSS